MTADVDQGDEDGPHESGTLPTLPTPAEMEQIPDPVVRHKVEHLVERFEMFRSPLLPPEILARYGNVVPGLPEKFVQWTEN